MSLFDVVDVGFAFVGLAGVGQSVSLMSRTFAASISSRNLCHALSPNTLGCRRLASRSVRLHPRVILYWPSSSAVQGALCTLATSGCWEAEGLGRTFEVACQFAELQWNEQANHSVPRAQ